MRKRSFSQRLLIWYLVKTEYVDITGSARFEQSCRQERDTLFSAASNMCSSFRNFFDILKFQKKRLGFRPHFHG